MKVYDAIKLDILYFLLGMLLVMIAMDYWRIGYDATDDTERGLRSGIGLHVDHETGCHYLSTPNGGITPRLDRTGSHICREALR